MAFARAKQDRRGRPPDRSAPGVSCIIPPRARASCEGSLPLVRTFPSCCSSAVRTALVSSGFSLAVVFLTYDKEPRRSAAGSAIAPNPAFHIGLQFAGSHCGASTITLNGPSAAAATVRADAVGLESVPQERC